MIDIKNAETKQLLKFYNSNIPKSQSQITKFRDRATAEKRCQQLLDELNAKSKVKHKSSKTVGALIRKGILDALPAEEIVKQIRTEFPTSKSTEKDVSWWKSKMKKDGFDIPKPKDEKEK